MPDPPIFTMPPADPATFDDRRCITCGREWASHSPECGRHAYRPRAAPDAGTKGALAGHLIEMERMRAAREDLVFAPTPTAEGTSSRDRLLAHLDGELTDPAMAEIARAVVRRALCGDFQAVQLLLRIDDAPPGEEAP